MDEESLRIIIRDEISKNITCLEDANKSIEDGKKAAEKIAEDLSVAKSDFIKELKSQASLVDEKRLQIDTTLASALSDHLTLSKNDIDDAVVRFVSKSNEIIKEKSEKFDEINNKVSSLLPLASVESIACSYIESAKRQKQDELMWNAIFIVSILIIFCIPIFVARDSVIDVFSSIFNVGKSNQEEKTITYMLNLILHSLPFEAPMIWLAIYAVKQSKKAKRLLEEYYHKYTTSMTFIGMQKNVYEPNSKYRGFSLESENQKELNRKFISSIFENPSLTLEKQVTADLPIEELLPLIEKVGPDNVKLLLETVGKSVPQKG